MLDLEDEEYKKVLRVLLISERLRVSGGMKRMKEDALERDAV
jgi:hypothetical protein